MKSFKNAVIRVMVLTLLLGSLFSFNAVEANANNLSPQLEGVDYWRIDEANGYIYTFYQNKVTFINLDDLTVEKVVTLNSRIDFMTNLMDIEIDDGTMYILDDNYTVYLIDIQSKSFVREITLGQDELIWDIAVDNDRIYFSLAETNSIFYYDLLRGQSTIVDLNSKYYDAVLATDSENDLLYVGSTTGTSSSVDVISTVDNTVIDIATVPVEDGSYYTSMLVNNGDVFYAGYSFDGSDINNITGNYQDEVWFVSANYVITYSGLYDRYSFELVDEYIYDALIDSEDNLYLLNESNQIEKVSSLPNSGDDSQTELTDAVLKYLPTDLDESHWAYEYLTDFLYADLLSGYKDNAGEITLKPNNQITRAEFVTIVVRALGLTDTTGATQFTDVNSTAWYYQPIQIANANGIVNGVTATTFAPNKPIQRDEITAIIVRAFESINYENGQPKQFADVSEYWATPYIDKASSVGIVNGKTTTEFYPRSNATRAEAVTMLSRALNMENNLVADDQELINEVTNFLNELDGAYNATQFEQVSQIINNDTTGFYKAYQDFNLDIIKSMSEYGITTENKLKSEPQFTVVHKANSFAIVEVDGLLYDYIYTFDGETDTLTQDLSGQYYLKRMTTGEWKIYRTELPNL